MKDNAILETLKQVRKLLKYVNHLADGMIDINGMRCFDHHVPDCDGATLSVDPKSGLCTLTTWQESGHNGSPYGIENSILSPEAGHKALNEVLQKLEREAMEKARIEAIEELTENMAKAKLKSVLGK